MKKSYDKVTVGKAIWKLEMMSSLLFGKAVVMTAKSTITKIQAIENRVWKYLMGLGGYTTIAALRGEKGVSMMESRIMESMLMFVNDTLTSNFEKIKTYMNHDIGTGKGQWIRAINEYREKLGISWPEFRMLEKKELKRKIREYDTQIWMEEMLHKPSLQWYRIGKKKIGYEMCYRNTKHSAYLAKAKTNFLQLELHL